MKLDDMTYGDMKRVSALFNNENISAPGLSRMIGQKCIIRTYSAGVWFGEVEEKSGNEVIIKDARRLWRWTAGESISLSGVALSGIVQSQSKVAPAVDAVWLVAIELIPCTKTALLSIEGAEDAVAG